MAADEIHIADTPILEITIKDQGNSPEIVDISTATVKEVLLRKPVTGATLVKAGSFTTNGTDGKLQYQCILTDLDEEGIWHIQGYVLLGSSSPTDSSYHSDTDTFEVFPNLR